ncbi:MAG: 30S ribosome-binding factor RbfA, partial [bacterium]
MSDDFRSLMITVTHVKLSPDYRYGDVWVSALGDHKHRDEVIAILTAKSGWIRHLLGSRLYIRHIPELRFHPDDTLERAARIDQILHREGLI